MTATHSRPGSPDTWVGQGLDRVDGPHKVTGTAPYPSDVTMPGMLHAMVVTSTVPAGSITKIDTSALLTLPGVRAVFTHENFPRLNEPPVVAFGDAPAMPLQDARISFHGQEVALVVADTPQEAVEAARLIEITYAQEPARLDWSDGVEEPLPYLPDVRRGDVDAGWANADARVGATYTTAENVNNPLGLMGSVAVWDGDHLDFHDSTQWPVAVRKILAAMFGVPESGVRVLVPYLGGGFGAGLNTWPYKILCAGAARVLDRPVKLMLTRPQMFKLVGHRPDTEHRVRLAARRDGTLTAIEHRARSMGALDKPALGLLTAATSQVYACPNVTTVERTVRLNRRYPAAMRGPGEAEGNWAIETALDELAYELGLDPLELRLRNISALVHPGSGLPWSSNALVECCRVGAEVFGWSRRDPRPGSMSDGDLLLGWGMATAFYGAYLPVSTARVTLYADGTAAVRAAGTDIGTGTYTVITQLAADLLGLQPRQVDFRLGDSDLPDSAQSGGSGLASSLSAAVMDAVANLRGGLLGLLDPASPLRGASPDEVVCRDGALCRDADPSARISFGDLLTRGGLNQLSAEGRVRLPDPQQAGMHQAGGFGARYVEVAIDPLIGRLRVRRIVSATDAGRILNPKLARSQIIGGTVGGIGMAMFEETVTDPDTGRVANGTFGDYLIASCADVPDVEVLFVGGPDRFSPAGTKGVGEIGLVGVAAAIGNAVFHATGRRLRGLPITIDQLLL
ncbi:xanthine dehydrogenase family protein molybdopterin-binding subunit [Catellatospora tritici]|uniref:xanthine dehydrogenase family protein molybdopterin-binding subunit n=1 Tax=Catellatospora tritici TaxID=2851566 RepID=UPI001C2D7C6B|nr:xanthine dehydrogenase family protein molybdopterin-binding subunit [Catellatospora tritici]MBV1853592.1 xanthine dehydrogenase family protein molybdopterin-binding subunit [Catellatospora tritici]